MDIKRIEYNYELIKNKVRLQKELDMINTEIEKRQSSCNHINVCIGWSGPFLYRGSSIHRCLLCGENEPIEYKECIEAQDYKKEEYSHGELESYREKRFNELQNLTLDIINNEPTIKEEELVKKLKMNIENNK